MSFLKKFMDAGKAFQSGINSARSLANGVQQMGEQLTSTKKNSPSVLDLPMVRPGMNTQAEDWFREEIRRLGVGTHSAYLVSEQWAGGWETSVKVDGLKIAQVLRKYEETLGEAVKALNAEAISVRANIEVGEDLEIRILIPFPEQLMPWLAASPEQRPNLPLKPPPAIRIKEARAHLDALSEVLNGATEWKGTIRLERAKEMTGKYSGHTTVQAFIGNQKIGAIGARFRTKDGPAFDLVEKESPTEVKGSIYLSEYDGEPYATIYLQ